MSTPMSSRIWGLHLSYTCFSWMEVGDILITKSLFLTSMVWKQWDFFLLHNKTNTNVLSKQLAVFVCHFYLTYWQIKKLTSKPNCYIYFMGNRTWHDELDIVASLLFETEPEEGRCWAELLTEGLRSEGIAWAAIPLS